MKKVFPYLLIITLTLPIIWPFLQKGFFWTQDIIYLTRIYAMSTAVADGQFPVRWISIFRYGEPLFNYYAPLPYYFGAIIHSFGFDFITSAKILFIFITLLSGFFMYRLAGDLWGKLGGLVSSVLYLYAPYRGVDTYIRGALSELTAFIWFPAIFWSSIKYYQTPKLIYLLVNALSWALLILSHNIMAIAFAPFYLIFVVLYSFINKKYSTGFKNFLSLFLGISLSTTYWLPAFVEKSLVKTQSTLLSFDNFVNQFVKIPEFILIQWNGTVITHELGPAGLFLLALCLLTLINLKKNNKPISLIIIILSLFGISIFLQTLLSLNIWQIFSILNFIQFPWRFSGISFFFLSLLGGSLLVMFQGKKLTNYLITILAILAIVFLQKQYFQPIKINSLATDSDYINLDPAYLPKDYLPTGVKQNPTEEFSIKPTIQKSNYYQFSIPINKSQNIVLPIYYFPGWNGYLNNEKIIIARQVKTGLITLNLPKGNNLVEIKFEDTPLRLFANITSLISLIILIWLTRKSLHH